MEKITMKEKIDVQKPDDLGLDISDPRYFLVMLLFSAVVFFPADQPAADQYI